MGFERGEYATIMALTAGVSMTVSFSTPFALGIFKPRTLMITSQVLFLAAGITLAVFTFPLRFRLFGYHADLRRFLGRFWCGDESGVRAVFIYARA